MSLITHHPLSACLSPESKWYVAFNDIEIGDRIGEGQFGDVYTGVMTTKEGRMEVAVKSCKMAGTLDDKMKFMREAGSSTYKPMGFYLGIGMLIQWHTFISCIIIFPNSVPSCNEGVFSPTHYQVIRVDHARARLLHPYGTGAIWRGWSRALLPW